MPDDPNTTEGSGGPAPQAGVGPDGVVPDPDAEFRRLAGPARLAFFSIPADPPILADRKAAFILAVAGLIVTVLLFFLDRIAAAVRGPHLAASVLLLSLLGVLAVLLAVAARWAYAGYVMLIPPMPPSLALFRDVAARPLDAYAADIAALTLSQAVDAILHYNYTLATLAVVKFRLVNRALRCMRIAIPLWMLILLLLAVWR